MMQRLLTAIAAAIVLIGSGCSGRMGALPDFLHAGPWWQAAQTDAVVRRAREWEAQGELGIAIDHWRLVRHVATDQTDAEREIDRLKKKIDDAVATQYQKGLLALKNKRQATARNHFLAALRLDPTFQPALKQIQTRYSSFPLSVYLSGTDENPASVAQKRFHDTSKAFLVAWFNDLPGDKPITPGTLLILPKIDIQPDKKVPNHQPPDWLAEARALLAESDFDAALTRARQADHSNPEVQALMHTIQLQQANELIDAKRLEEAEVTLAAIPDTVAGKSTALEKLDAATGQRQFDSDMADIRREFEAGHYAQSLANSEAMLKSAPDNAEINRIAAESRYRLAQAYVDEGRYIDARELLAQADDTHEASAALKETVRLRLMKLAQIHYRNGVKHFINEKLDDAIAEWEKTLACNPDHAKARENIAIARRLKEKIEHMP